MKKCARRPQEAIHTQNQTVKTTNQEIMGDHHHMIQKGPEIPQE